MKFRKIRIEKFCCFCRTAVLPLAAAAAALLARPDVLSAAYEAEDIVVGSRVQFGTYEQNGEDDGAEELEWIVLDKDEEQERALLITADCIACMPFHTEKTEITWKDCSLRQWLNGVFLQEAFSDDEQNRIVTVDLETEADESIDESGIVESSDRVFLLNADEASAYFQGKTRRLAGVSDAVKNEAEKEADQEDGSEEQLEPAVSEWTDSAFWWLRSAGKKQDCAACVGSEGTVVTAGYVVLQPNFGVRPALWMELD